MQRTIKMIFALILCLIFTNCGPFAGLKTKTSDDDSNPSDTKVVLSNSIDPDKCRKIAILPFINNGNVKGDYNFAASDKLSVYLMEIGFTIIERTQLEAVFNELSLSLTGALKKDDLNRIGQQLNIDAIVFGTVNWKYIPGKAYISAYGGSSKEGRYEIESLTAKFVNVISGEVVLSAHTESSYKSYEQSIADGIMSSISKKMKTNQGLSSSNTSAMKP